MRPEPGGFTLIEILVAISIFAIVVSILFGSFSFLFSRADRVKDDIAVYQQGRICFDRLTRDLHSLYVALPPAYEPPDFDDEPDPYRVTAETAGGGESYLRFSAFSHLPLGGGVPVRIAEIIYYLDATEDRGLVLRRRDTVLKSTEEAFEQLSDIDDSVNDPVVCEHVQSLEFVFLDTGGNGHEYWDSESNEFDYATPRAVRVILVAGSGEAEHRFETTIDLPVYREPWDETV